MILRRLTAVVALPLGVLCGLATLRGAVLSVIEHAWLDAALLAGLGAAVVALMAWAVARAVGRPSPRDLAREERAGR